jgi:hypothetical protein
MRNAAVLALALALFVPSLPAGQDAEAPAQRPADEADAAAVTDPRSALAVPAPAPRDALGLALWDAREGRVDAGLARVSALRAGADDDLGPRLEREALRLAAWRDLRNAYLAGLAAAGGKLVLMDGDERVRVTVQKIAAGQLHLAKNKAGWETYPVDALPAGDLAQAMGKDADGLAPAWVRIYGYALAENDKWSKLLKDDGAESVALRADAEADFAPLLRAGRCIAALEALSGEPDPVGLAAADALLARVDALRAEGLPVVRERAAALRTLAGIAHGARFDALGLGVALKGKVTELGGGRVRLEYAFDAEAELADFARDDGYLLELRKRLLAVPDDVQDEFHVRDGSLRCLGKAARRLALPFSAPLSAEYEVSLDPPKSGEPTGFFFFVGVCDNGARRFAWCSNFGDLEDWSDPRDVRQALAQNERAVELGRTYTMKLTHDGERLTSFRDTVEVASLECPRTSGAIFLWLQTAMPLNVRRFAIEGRVDAAGIAKLRAAWVAAQLAD